MEDWNELMEGKVFLTDLGAPRQTELAGQPITLGRYAVWSPLRGTKGHAIVEVGDDLEELSARYGIPAERICVLACSGGNEDGN